MGRYATVGETINLVLTMDKVLTGKYPTATILNSSNTVLSTVNLSEHDATNYAGVYKATYTVPSTEQDLWVIYRVYSDSGHTTLDTSIPIHAEETISVVDISDDIAGTGPYSYVFTIEDSVSGNPIDGANIYVYTDSARTNLIVAGTTDSLGVWTAYFQNAGTYYVRMVATGHENSETSITVS